MSGYWYLGQPYGRYPHGQEAAFILACETTAMLLKAGISTFSPIAHSHPLHVHGGLDAVDHDFWINTVDRPLMQGAKGLIFLEADGWANSMGLHEEIVEFTKAGKPVVFMQPGVIPEELLPEDVDEGTTEDWLRVMPPLMLCQAPDPLSGFKSPKYTPREALCNATNGDKDALDYFDFMVAHTVSPEKAGQEAAETWAGRGPNWW
jgi:hypothetical protein